MNTSNCFKIKVLEENKPGADYTLKPPCQNATTNLLNTFIYSLANIQ